MLQDCFLFNVSIVTPKFLDGETLTNSAYPEVQSEQGIYCLSFLLHCLDALLYAVSSGVKVFTIEPRHEKSKKISNDQELIQSDPTSCPQN